MASFAPCGCVLLANDVFDTGLASLLDTFETANELAGETRFAVTVCASRSRIRTHHGLTVATVPPPSRAPDLAIVPALACKQPDTIVAALARPDVIELAASVARYARRARIAAACTGTFVLGRAGVLDGRRATTSWWLGPTFRSCFPAVELDEAQLIVSDAKTITAGAALAHIDLALPLIRGFDPPSSTNLTITAARGRRYRDLSRTRPIEGKRTIDAGSRAANTVRIAIHGTHVLSHPHAQLIEAFYAKTGHAHWEARYDFSAAGRKVHNIIDATSSRTARSSATPTRSTHRASTRSRPSAPDRGSRAPRDDSSNCPRPSTQINP